MLAPSSPLLPTWMWSWEPTFSSPASLWWWGKGAPPPLHLSAAHSPGVWPWHTPPGGGHPLLTGSRCWMFQTWPQPTCKVFSFRKRARAASPPPEDIGRIIPWDLSLPFIQSWPFDFCLIFPDFQTYAGPNFKWLWKFRCSGFCK